MVCMHWEIKRTGYCWIRQPRPPSAAPAPARGMSFPATSATAWRRSLPPRTTCSRAMRSGRIDRERWHSATGAMASAWGAAATSLAAWPPGPGTQSPTTAREVSERESSLSAWSIRTPSSRTPSTTMPAWGSTWEMGARPITSPGPRDRTIFQNYPIFTSAQTDGKTTTIAGTLLGAPNSTYTLQVFWSPSPDPSVYGEGQNLICTTSATTDSTGNSVINLSLPAAPPPGAAISATATDDAGNTSEFSPDISIKGATTPVAAVADLSLAMTPSASTVHVGDSQTYTITASNQGPSPASSVRISVPLTAGLSFSSASTTQGSASFASGQLTASLGSLAVGAQATVSVVVQALGVGTFSTTASITSDQAEPTSGDNSATVSLVVEPVVDLAVSIAANPSPVAVGQDLVYTVDVTNHGPDDASAVTLTNVLPAGVAFISASSNAGSPPTLSAGTVTAAVGALASGSVATLLITVQPTSSPGSILVDTASVSESSADFDANPADTASISVPVRDVSNLVLTMTPSVPSVPIGQTLSDSMTVSNPGPADEPDATLTVPLPPDVNLVPDSSPQGSAWVVGQGMVSADLGALASSGAATVTLTISPQASAFGLLTMSASVQGYNADIETAQAEASTTVTVAAAAGLSIAIMPQCTPAHQAQDLTYTLTVNNAGPSGDTNVVATSLLPRGTAFVSASSSQQAQPALQAGGISALLGTIAAS